MLHRRATIILATAVLAAACTETVDQQPPAESAVIASYSSPNIPTPNDLALAAAPTLPAGPGKQFLQMLAAEGGFPSDQAPTFTVPIKAVTYDAAVGDYVDAAKPSVDVSTVTPETFALFKLGGGTAVRVDTEPLPAESQVAGEIRVVKKADATGSRRLEPGRYVFAARGGASGVKTTNGQPLTADAAVALTVENIDLSNRENQPPGGIPPATLAQVQTIQSALWQPLEWNTAGATGWAPAPDPQIVPAYEAIDAAFPYREVASIATFEIAPLPAGAAVRTDSGSGQIPFPSDFLLDPTRPVPGTNNTRFYVRNIPSLGPAAPGLATLDGFSTTSLLLAPLSAPVQASTITHDTVRIYELIPTGATTPPDTRRLVDVTSGGSPEYLTQPPNLIQTVGATQVSAAIGLQPAIPVPTGPTTILPLPPLKQKARYLVVITDGVKDLQNNGLQRSTLGKILFELEGPLYDPATGQSTVGGVSATDARSLQALRGAVQLVAPTFELDGRQVVMGYTISTQTVSDVSASLSALPYGAEAAASTAIFTTSAVTPFDPATLGIPADRIPRANTAAFLEANVGTLDVLDAATGALNPAVATWGAAEFAQNRKDVRALIAVPNADKVAMPCPAAPQLKCAPLVVFHHGINGGRHQMLAVADALAARGFVVAAIDSPFHGDRAPCESDAECEGGTCALDAANQKAPGVCTSGKLKFNPERLTTVAAGNSFISSNFFRTRDAIRQDVLDQSALVLAVARPPQGMPQQAQNPLQAALGQAGVAVNPLEVHFAGLSLGAMMGTSIVATNPRFSRAAFTANGGTVVDTYINSPVYRDTVEALLASIIPGFTFDKVTPGAQFDAGIAARYAQTLIVMKWILDPAEPLNYAAEVETNALASEALVTALGPLAPATTAYAQMTQGDQSVLNPFSALVYANAGLTPAVYTSDTYPSAARHELAYAQDEAGAVVRADLAEFLATGSAPVGPIPLPL